VRLLFVNLNRSPAYGGVERWMVDAAAGLGARGHGCTLLGRPGAPWLQAAARRGLPVRADHRGVWAARVRRLRAAMCALQPDLVIAKGKKAARMAAWGRATGGGGRVAMFLGLTHELDAGRWIDRFTWRGVDAGIVVAHGAARWYEEHGFGPPAKLQVLWKGVDVAAADAAAARAGALRAALGLGPRDLAIGTVGRLAWQKGLVDLFAAVQLAGHGLARARVFVIGDGRDRPVVEAAAAALGRQVVLLGQRDDVPALLAAMDVVVQPSRREVMAQTTLEAMAAGKAVVSTRTCGADEAIEDGSSGVLVPVEEPGRLAEALAALAADPARRAALGAAARRRIEAHFTMAHMIERCEALCARLLVAAPATGAGGG